MKYWKAVSVDKAYLAKDGLDLEKEGVIEYISMLEEEAGKDTSYEKTLKVGCLRVSEMRNKLREEVIASIDEGKKMLPKLSVNQ